MGRYTYEMALTNGIMGSYTYEKALGAILHTVDVMTSKSHLETLKVPLQTTGKS